ncbi:DUF2079 domain-containing protein [Subtercola vilae]|uniref:DUF2079 domain-containing protein n=1 Tax=Subtercola vilae TaxID=2056433 RepID=A0A4T2C7D0_9MICO|nr:DUF2079 domain-containing protein [Subtercola vilae]TIH40127.1 DUF2079 domain-containing protein [Subtercola vilae]
MAHHTLLADRPEHHTGHPLAHRGRVVHSFGGAHRLGWGSALVLAAIFATLALQRHAQLLTTGYDLGIFDQGVRAYSEGKLPSSLLKGIDYSLLGDHFSPILATLAPLYLVFNGPQVLLVAQAVLIAVGVVPLTIWAARSLGPKTAIVVAISYGLAGGLAHAVAFDFHEIACAVPLLSFSLTALGNRRLRAAALWAAPLVLVKEDLGLTVAAIGALIAVLAGRSNRPVRRLGIATVMFGLAATVIESYALIPLFNPGGQNSYTGQIGLDGAMYQLMTLMFNNLKVETVILLLLPTAFIALRSPIVLLVIPTLAWRFLSDNPGYWGNAFHYDAVLVPIVSAAFVDALVRLRRRGGGSARHRLVLLVSLVTTTALLTASPLAQLFSPALWQPSEHVTAARSVLAKIPDGASVAASNSLAAQLTGRAEVSLFGILPIETNRPEFIVADTSIPHQFPLDAGALARLVDSAEGSGYRMVDAADGVVLLARQ